MAIFTTQNQSLKILSDNRLGEEMPVRKIPVSHLSITGVVPYDKAVGKGAYESTLERDYLTLLQFRPDVKSFEVQPCRIEWKEPGGRPYFYPPDVFVEFVPSAQRLPMIVEIKYFDDFKKKWAAYRTKFRAAGEYAAERGWVFRLVTERAIRSDWLYNCDQLLPYVSDLPDFLESYDVLKTKLKELGKTTPMGLVSSLFSDRWKQAEILPALWHLIGTFQIEVDLNKRLTMSTPIRAIDPRDWRDSLEERFYFLKGRHTAEIHA